MGGDAFKLKVCSHDGVAVIAFHGVDGGWMPGVYKIHVVEHPGPGHELLGSGAFLGGAAEVDDGAVPVSYTHLDVYKRQPNERQPETPQNLDPLTAVKCIRKPDFRNLVPVILDLSVAGHRYRPAREHILWKHVSTDELINYV